MKAREITIFLCGDVMTGRGIDQALPHPSPSRLYEPFVTDARVYVDLAEGASGPIARPLGSDEVWGDVREELARYAPDVRLINLETAVTASEDAWKDKGINYRMHPANIPVLSSAGIDVAALANNHVLDWGYAGLEETLETLQRANIRHAGAGRNRQEAERPAVMELGEKGRVLVFSSAMESSGVPPRWAATEERAGVNFLRDYSAEALRSVRDMVLTVKRPGDIIVWSIHWGPNWGYEIPAAEEQFGRSLIDEAGVDVVHGHSSHHVKRIEVHRGKLILYGCGDFLNDYEGIGGHEAYRGELGLMYFAKIDPASGGLLGLDMTPTRVRRFRINRASPEEARWLAGILNREGKAGGTGVDVTQDNRLRLRWRA